MSKTRCNTLTLDAGSVMDGIKSHLLIYLRKAEDRLLEQMEREVLRTTHGGAPGKPEWRSMMREKLEVVNELVTKDYMEASVGLDMNMLYTDFVKAMIVTYGSGSKVFNGSIEAGPPGRIVWDSNVDGKHPSEAQDNWLLPDEFNQTGNQFIQNAVAQMNKHFKDTLEEAASTLPSSIFYGNLHVN